MTVPSNGLTRRAFVRAAAFVLGVTATGSAFAQRALGVKLRPVFSLDPNCASTPETCNHPTVKEDHLRSCSACYACISHAKNKRWASKEAITRAHPCCRCSVTVSWVPENAFNTMFGSGPNARLEFDQRMV